MIILPARLPWKKLLRASGKAMEQYHELRDIYLKNPRISRTQGDEIKLEALRKTDIESVNKATSQGYELQRVFQDGWARAKDWTVP